MKNGIIAAGNWIVDHLKIIDVYPVEESLANIKGESMNNGGAPYNVLKDLAKMRATFPLKAIGLVGDDDNGRWIRNDCQAHGIDVEQLRTHPHAPTSYTDVMTVESTGRRTFFHQRGANAFLDVEQFDFSSANEKLFHLGYLLLLDALDVIDEDGTTGAARVLEKACLAGLKTSVDLVSENSDRFARVVRPSLPYIHYLFMNEFEAGRCTGVDLSGAVPDVSALHLAADRLFEAGVREWVIIHFPQGAYARSKDRDVIIQGAVQVPQEKIAGTVGAGDAFAAGTLFGIHEKWDMRQALRLGVCAAAASLSDVSCSDGVKPFNECLKLGEEYSFHTLYT